MSDPDDCLDNGPTNGSSLAGPYDHWYTVQQAAAMMEVGIRRVYTLAQTGEIRTEKDTKGVTRYDPEQVMALAPGGVGIEAQRNQTDVIRVLQQLIKVQLDGQRDFLKLVPDATVQLLEQQAKIIEFQARMIQTQNEEIKSLRDERRDMLKAHETTLSQQEERAAAREKMQREQARLDKLVDQLGELVPRLGEQFLLGADTQKLVSSLDDELFEALVSDVSPLKPDQKEWAQSIRKRMAERRKADAKKSKADAPPEQKTEATA